MSDSAKINLSHAVVMTPEKVSSPEAKAVTVLIEEIGKRSGVTLSQVHDWPTHHTPVIVAGSESVLKGMIHPYRQLLDQLPEPGPEGYRIAQVNDGQRHIVLIVGTDARGVLYGVGRLLRSLEIDKNSVYADPNLRLSGTPRYPMRGAQLGYRPKTNAYDAWSVEQFEQYIRELAIFGANSIEILPPRTDDDAVGPHLKVDPLHMMVRLSEIIHSYGLDTWVWYPNMAENYSDPATIQTELEEREEIFSKVPHIHAILIPGGDPGDVEAELLFQWSEKMAAVLQKHHPHAKIWLSPQIMRSELAFDWLETFYANVNKEPEWLGGIAFAPWERTPLPELRKKIPAKFPIRRYEDICHNYRAQYPVHNWDLAFAMTYGRESINPRPVAHKHIHNLLQEHCIGNITYSEGIYDDVNKFVWLGQDWDSDSPVIETLRDYARFFIGSRYAEDVAQGLMALERNWEGPLVSNEGVDVTFKQWRQIETTASAAVLNNYRLQMGLLRAYYDAYVKRRLIYEAELERKALEVLQGAASAGSLYALDRMQQILQLAETESVEPQYRRRCDELADELFENIGAQTTVERHNAIALGRGAFLSTIDVPLNNAKWLLTQADLIRSMVEDSDRLSAINAIVNRTNPGPGGFYDNFGTSRSLHRVDHGEGWVKDPGHLASPRLNFAIDLHHIEEEKQRGLGGIPLAWLNSVSAIYDVPLKITYSDLDPFASYSIRVTYTGKLQAPYRVRLVANGEHIIHDDIEVLNVRCEQSPIPEAALSEGKLELTWHNLGGDRGRDIAEIWIIKTETQ